MSIRAHRIGLVGVGALVVGSLAVFGGTSTSAAVASSARGIAPPAQRVPTTGEPFLFDGNFYGFAFLNWSGYVVTTGPYTSVTGDWTVPEVTTAHGPGFSSAWTGVGGVTTSDLIQVGTSQSAVHGAASYSAWWTTNEEGYTEQTQWALSCVKLPCTGSPLTLTVEPGDKMVASVDETGTTLWSITLRDTTTGVEGKVTTIPHAASTGATGGNSAEWIVERTALVARGGGSHFAKLANFGTVTFDTATVNTGTPHLTASTTASDAAVMVQGAARVIAIPSSPDAGANGFRVAYGDVAPTPPTS